MSPASLRLHAGVWGFLLSLIWAIDVLAQIGADRSFWDRWQPSRELRFPAYAERIHAAQIVRTRANTASNLAYILVGAYVIAFTLRQLPPSDPCHPSAPSACLPLQRSFGIACCGLGFASVGSGEMEAGFRTNRPGSGGNPVEGTLETDSVGYDRGSANWC